MSLLSDSDIKQLKELLVAVESGTETSRVLYNRTKDLTAKRMYAEGMIRVAKIKRMIETRIPERIYFPGP